MVFRKTAVEYVKDPVGLVSPYRNGYVIDSENNVYSEDFGVYTKVGFDIPEMDMYVASFPEIGRGIAFMNLLFPQRDSSGNIFVMLIIYFWARLSEKIFRFYDWLIYKFTEKVLAKHLLRLADKRPKLRLFLPVAWFYETDDDQVKYMAIGAVASVFWGSIVAIASLVFTFAVVADTRDFYGGNPLAVGALAVAIIYCLPLLGTFPGFKANYRLAKELGVDQF